MVEKDEFMGREYLKGVELALQVKKFKVWAGFFDKKELIFALKVTKLA
jgi:hypothetical protein